MTVGEVIEYLKRYDPNIPVCCDSETSNWDMEESDIWFCNRDGRWMFIMGYRHGSKPGETGKP